MWPPFWTSGCALSFFFPVSALRISSAAALVGSTLLACSVMDHVTLSCAPLVVTGAPGSFALKQGATTALPPQGDTGGGSPFTPVTCPSPGVITLLSGTAQQRLNSLDVACATAITG